MLGELFYCSFLPTYNLDTVNIIHSGIAIVPLKYIQTTSKVYGTIFTKTIKKHILSTSTVYGTMFTITMKKAYPVYKFSSWYICIHLIEKSLTHSKT